MAKKKTRKTSGYSDNSERNINFKFDRLRAVDCKIWSEWNFIHQTRTAEKTRARNWNRTLQLSLFVPKINVFMPIYGTRPWIQRKVNTADVLVTELTGQGLKTADWSRGCDVKKWTRSYCACGKLRINDLVVNMADDRWPTGSCILAHFSNFWPYQDVLLQ